MVNIDVPASVGAPQLTHKSSVFLDAVYKMGVFIV